MKRLMATVTAVVMAAMLLWTPAAAGYDDGAAGNEAPRCLRAIVSVDAPHGRTIEITVRLGDWFPVPRPAAPRLDESRPAPSRSEAPVWSVLSAGEDLLWKTAAAVRRRALDRLSDLLLRRKVN